jgi:hypothetical protein
MLSIAETCDVGVEIGDDVVVAADDPPMRANRT